MKFDLKAWMTDLDLLYELADKGIGGDTRHEVVSLLNGIEKLVASKSMYEMEGLGTLFEVIKNGDVQSSKDIADEGITKYAIVRFNIWNIHHTGTKIDGDKELCLCNKATSRLFLAGINDENRYFLRPLDALPDEKLDGSIELIIDWVNRADQGFRRLQGDLLIKFYPYEGNKSKIDGCATSARYRVPSIVDMPNLAKNERGEVWSDSTNLSSRLSPSQFNLGDHLITAHGGKAFVVPSFASAVPEPVIAEGSSITLEHPEHKTVDEQIPQGHYAVITSQRGRMPIQMGSRSFD